MRTSLLLLKTFMSVSFLVMSAFSPVAAQVEQIQAPFPGFLFRPSDHKPHPGVILLHGSEGGNGDYWLKTDYIGLNSAIPVHAQKFAELGYVTYALCYFDCRKQKGFSIYPPDELVNVDLYEITYRAFDWLRKSPMIQDGKVSIMGYSRGAEQVLLLESILIQEKQRNPRLALPHKIISVSPYQETVKGIPLWWAQEAKQNGKYLEISPDVSAWSYKRRPIQEKIPIVIKDTTIPTLITGFRDDPVWRTAHLEDYRKQIARGDLFSMFISPTDLAQDQLNSLPSVFPKVSVVEFQSSGHTTPQEGEARKFFFELIARFLKQ